MHTSTPRFGDWRTSSYTNGEGACVEVAWAAEPAVGIRDTKKREGGVLTVDRSAFQEFVSGIAR